MNARGETIVIVTHDPRSPRSASASCASSTAHRSRADSLELADCGATLVERAGLLCLALGIPDRRHRRHQHASLAEPAAGDRDRARGRLGGRHLRPDRRRQAPDDHGLRHDRRRSARCASTTRVDRGEGERRGEGSKGLTYEDALALSARRSCSRWSSRRWSAGAREGAGLREDARSLGRHLGLRADVQLPPGRGALHHRGGSRHERQGCRARLHAPRPDLRSAPGPGSDASRSTARATPSSA